MWKKLLVLCALLIETTRAEYDNDASHIADHITEGLPVPSYSENALNPNALPIVGQKPWQYKFEPLKLQMPPNSDPPYSHGLEIDDDANLYLT